MNPANYCSDDKMNPATKCSDGHVNPTAYCDGSVNPSTYIVMLRSFQPLIVVMLR